VRVVGIITINIKDLHKGTTSDITPRSKKSKKQNDPRRIRVK